MNIKENKIIYIQDDSQLLKHFSSVNVKEIFLDTEFTRRTTYWPNLELIQVMWQDGPIFLIDCQTVGDFDPLTRLLLNQDVLKIFHSARQDLEGIWKFFKIFPAPLFDLQLAAGFLGYGPSIGLGDLYHFVCGKILDKQEQFSAWHERPLRLEQLYYAAADVCALFVLYPQIQKELETLSRLRWADTVMKDSLQFHRLISVPQETWLRLRTQISSPKSLYVLMSFSTLREELAQQSDMRRHDILSDKALIALCDNLSLFFSKDKSDEPIKPSVDLFDTICGQFKKNFEQNFAVLCEQFPSQDTKKLKFFLRYGASIPLTFEQQQLMLHIKNIVNSFANKLVIPFHFLADNDLIESFVLNPIKEHKLIAGWRGELWGNEILNLIEKEGALKAPLECSKVSGND